MQFRVLFSWLTDCFALANFSRLSPAPTGRLIFFICPSPVILECEKQSDYPDNEYLYIVIFFHLYLPQNDSRLV